MRSFRRHLGALATTWLLFQVVSLSALLPGVCCIAHAEEAQADPESCHKPSPASDECPMMSPDGQPCPEHAAHTANGERCVMNGTCNAPFASLASLFSAPAILADATAVRVEPSSAAIAIDLAMVPAIALVFDTPPPRT